MENKVIKGRFGKNYHVYELLMLAAGVVAIAVGISLLVKSGDKGGIWFIIAGGFFALLAVCIFLASAGRYFIFDGTRVSAKSGLFTKLNCDVTDIKICSAAMNTLSVILNDGKVKLFGALLNADEISTAINGYISVSVSDKDFETLKAEYDGAVKKRKNAMILMIVFLALTFAGVISAAAATGFNGVTDMSSAEKTVLYISFGFDFICIVLTFIFAKKGGKLLAKVTETGRMLNRWVLCNKRPQKPYRAMYRMTDDMTRVVLYGGFAPEQVYFEVEMIDDKYELHVIGVSPKMKLEDFDTEGLIKIENG